MQLQTEMRFLTDTFRVQSAPTAPLLQVPPQRGFPTVQGRNDKVAIKDANGNKVGILYPLPNQRADVNLMKKVGDDVPVCIVEESHSPLAAVPEITHRRFPHPGLASFLCVVSYGVEVAGRKYEAVVRGPRVVSVGSPSRCENDGHAMADLEIVDMHLAGYDANGGLITVRGGTKQGLPQILGEMKSVNKNCDFPASLFFDLVLEIAYWGES